MRHKNAVLFGTAAALCAVSAVQAADLPSRKSAPVEFVRVCDVYGAGFFWIPGTDTCLKAGGRLMIDSFYVPAKNAVSHRSTTGGTGTFASANAIDQYGWYARALLNMDARTQSAWGTVQTVFTLRFAAQSGLANTPAGYSAGVWAAGNNNTALIQAAYIRFAGFTVGQAGSNFLFLPPVQYHSPFNAGMPVGVRQFAYTATFGKGFSATLALENKADLFLAAGANTLGANPFTATPAIAGPAPQRLPVLVGNVRIEQSWGSAMLSGLVLENLATFANAPLAVVGNVGPQVRKIGWGVGAGLRINLPMIAAGDRFQMWASYGVGAGDYLYGLGLNSNFAVSSNFLGGFLRVDRSMTLFCVNAACTAGGAEQTKALNIIGVFTHYWTPTVYSNLSFTYLQVTPGSVTQNTAWSQGGLSKGQLWNVAAQLIWEPVPQFEIGLEVGYARLTQSLPLEMPAGLGTLASVSPSNWAARMRVARTF